MLVFLLACGGGEAPTSNAPAAAPAATAAAPAQAATPAAVGPDGPAEIQVAALAAIPSDAASVADGEKVFNAKGCGGCHAWGSKLVGPDLTGLTERRTTPWIQKMIQDPDTMTKKDPVARELFKSHMVQMPKQGVTDAEMPQLLAFVASKGK
jgi:hypothetical protein